MDLFCNLLNLTTTYRKNENMSHWFWECIKNIKRWETSCFTIHKVRLYRNFCYNKKIHCKNIHLRNCTVIEPIKIMQKRSLNASLNQLHSWVYNLKRNLKRRYYVQCFFIERKFNVLRIVLFSFRYFWRLSTFNEIASNRGSRNDCIIISFCV